VATGALAARTAPASAAPAPSPAPAAAPAAITTADLALMAIPVSRVLQVGRDGSHVGAGSGAVDAAEQAFKTIDPSDTAADVRARGFLVGYDLGIGWDSGDILSFSSNLSVFRDEAAAVAWMASQDAANRRFIAKPLPPLGVVISSGTAWVPTGLGPGAKASSGRLELAGTGWYAAGTGFRVGRIVASVTTARTRDGDLRAVVEANARLLRERILAVLAGQRLDGPPELPRKLDVGATRKPPGAPALDRLAVGTGDLPGGAVVRSGGWILSPGIVGYSRFIRAAVKPFGRSYAGEVTVTVLRHESARDAQGTYDAMVNPLFFNSMISRSARISTARTLKVELETKDEVKGIGDEAHTLVWRLDTPIGPGRVVVTATRVGRYVQAVIATGSTVLLQPEDVEQLLRGAVGRLRAAPAG
jgi:hypothetical protein